MNYDPERHHRRSTRLKNHDYSAPGAYFITLCTQDRLCIFGHVVNGKMILNDLGTIAQDEWLKSAVIRPEIVLDAFVVMPNHIHGIIIIRGDGRGDPPGRPY